VPKIKVTFDIDANGILSVTAKDEATGKDQKITITSNSGLEDSEIERMVNDAQAHEEDDKRRREAVETRNRADQLCYQVEKSLSEVKDKLEADKVAEVEAKVASLREAIDKQDDDAIKSGTEALEEVMKGVAEAAYAQAGAAAEAGAAPGAAPSEAAGDDDVIDAEFEEAD